MEGFRSPPVSGKRRASAEGRCQWIGAWMQQTDLRIHAGERGGFKRMMADADRAGRKTQVVSDCSRIHWAEGQEEFSFGFTSDLSLLRQLTPHRRPGQTKTAAQHCSCLETWALQVWKNPMNAAFHCLAFCRFLIFYSHFSFCLASFAPLVLCCSLILLQLAPSPCDWFPTTIPNVFLNFAWQTIHQPDS